MSTVHERIDGFQRRHAVLGYPIAVIYKFGDDQGHYLSAMITYYAFIAIFPLLLIATSLLGFVVQGDDELRAQILNSALSQFPIVGDKLGHPDELSGSTAAVVVGLLVALYGSLGVAQAGQHAINVAWAVPRNARPNPIISRLKSVLLLFVAGLAVLATAILNAFGSNPDVFGTHLDAGPQRLITLGTGLLNAAIFIALFRLASAYDHRLRSAIPGAITVAILWQLLQKAGEIFVREVIAGASSWNGTFALVLGLMGLLYVGAFIVVFGVEVNVVLAKRLYPRALLTPFTDNIDMTEADKRAYAGYVRAQRHKGFQTVDVRFDRRLQRAPPDDEEPDATLEEPTDPNGFAGRDQRLWTDD